MSESLSGAHYIWRTEGGFTYGFVYHQIDVKGSVTANSTETTHLYKQETYSVTLGIEMEGTNLLSILTFNPQYIYSFYGMGSHQYEKKEWKQDFRSHWLEMTCKDADTLQNFDILQLTS